MMEGQGLGLGLSQLVPKNNSPGLGFANKYLWQSHNQLTEDS